MATPQWARVAHTTIAEYMREEEVAVLRDRKLLAYMQQKGRVTFNHSGTHMDWKVRFRRAPVAGYADGDTLTFSRQNRHRSAELDWRGYICPDSVTKMEKLQNRGEPAIIKFVSEMAAMLIDDITEAFGDQLYIDGNAAGNTKLLHGVESFLGNSGAYSGGYIATPSDTYANLTTGLGDYGGSWSGTTWPIGTGDYHYDFWSPLIVDYTDTLWSASTKTWPNTCREATSFGILHSRKNRSRRAMVDLILQERELYRQFLELIRATERLTIARGSKGSGNTDFGFEDMINYDGVDIGTEYGVPSAVAYGFPTADMELCSLQGVLFDVEGPDPDISTLSDRVVITFMGNLRFRTPRNVIAWKAVT